MTVVVWSFYPLECQKLMDAYCGLFDQKPTNDHKNGSLIWYQYRDEALRRFWQQWLDAALLVGIIYEGEIK